MRRMLDPKKVGGLPSTIEFDKDGNRKVKKNLGVDGKLTLKSLVSNTNPDGDITKELGGSGGGGSITYMTYSYTLKIAPGTYHRNKVYSVLVGITNFDAGLPALYGEHANSFDVEGHTCFVSLYKHNDAWLGLSWFPLDDITITSAVSIVIRYDVLKKS